LEEKNQVWKKVEEGNLQEFKNNSMLANDAEIDREKAAGEFGDLLVFTDQTTLDLSISIPRSAERNQFKIH